MTITEHIQPLLETKRSPAALVAAFLLRRDDVPGASMENKDGFIPFGSYDVWQRGRADYVQ